MGVISSVLPRPRQYNEDQMNQCEWKYNKKCKKLYIFKKLLLYSMMEV